LEDRLSSRAICGRFERLIDAMIDGQKLGTTLGPTRPVIRTENPI